MNILIASARFFPYMGGIETHVHHVARRLVQRGHQVTILTSDLSGNLPAEEDHEGARVVRVKGYPESKDFYVAPGLWKVVNEGNWDVMHAQGCHTFFPPLAMMAAKKAGVPYVVSFHTGGHDEGWREYIRKPQFLAQRPLYAGAKRLIGCSSFEANRFRTMLKLPDSQFSVVYNGAELPPVPPRQPDADKLVVSIGRLEKYKGHHRAILAMPQVIKARPGTRLMIVGGGPYEGELRKLVDQLDLNGPVTFTRFEPTDRTGFAEMLSRASLFTLFSDYEAHPIAVLEALAAGLPVLVTDTSGSGEIASQGLAATVPLKASTEDVATAILAQLEHPLVPDPTKVVIPKWDTCVDELEAIYASSRREA